VASGDALSEGAALYYQNVRGVPASNIIRVQLPSTTDSISASDFQTLKAQIDAQMPAGVQAQLVTWAAPSRVQGSSCSMSLTSALTFGYSAQYCATSCQATSASPYYDSESQQPFTDLQMRPAMMLGATTLAGAQALIDRGKSAEATYPSGQGWLFRTSDVARSVRYTDFLGLPALWAASGLQLSYVDNSTGQASDSLSGKSGVLFYFTGLATVPGLTSNSYLPGAIGDSLTSYAGVMPDGLGQTTVRAWLDAGFTASYGNVEEPCNYPEKFPRASVLIDQYFRGASLIEAYWKSVQWPGQGLFVGDPLARPFTDQPSFTVSGNSYRISTRALRAGGSYSLQYQQDSSSPWQTLASFTITQAKPQTLSAPLPPSNNAKIRWQGPCVSNPLQTCTLATSP